MKNTIILLFMIIALIILQIYLSKRESKLLGLILPGISFIFSILAIFSIYISGDDSTAEIIRMFISTFIIYNIPTCILLVIYFKYKNK